MAEIDTPTRRSEGYQLAEEEVYPHVRLMESLCIAREGKQTH